MIKFFRSIRRKLLRENRFSRYLLYALGEIILVVIGILIALQINNWNDQNKHAMQEQRALKNLKKDFEYNRDEILELIKNNEDYIQACMLVLNQTGEHKSADFDLDLYLDDVTNLPIYSSRNGFLNDLINSGNLALIQNDLLRNRLSSWLPHLTELHTKEAQAEMFTASIIQYVSEEGSWLKSDELTFGKPTIDYPTSGFKVNNNKLLDSVEFENLLSNQLTFLYILKNEHQEILKLNQKIIKLLESEIHYENDA